MAAASGEGSSRKNEQFAHDVFLSFRGEDVRRSFIDHLRYALKREEITAFYDDTGLERGEEIQSKLYEAIESSKIAIVTFSLKYADSRWCLDELVKIMERRPHGLIVLPVFYYVEPTDVRHQSGLYKKAFHEHETKHGGLRVDKWRKALKSAADLAGFSPQNQTNGYEAQFVKHIVKEVVRKLDARQLDIPKYMVGEESSLIQKIIKWLLNGSSQVEVGIIHGLAGVGKTTIAKVIYNKSYRRFESSSFLLGVRTEYGKGNDFIHLQEQLICDITGNESVKIYNVPHGRQKIKKAIGRKKIFVVLDDVDEAEHFHAMFDYPDWFHLGSKILITTRNQHLLINNMSLERFEAGLLDEEKSTELFSYHAFGQPYPPQDYMNISMSFIKYCDGLPLALEVLASSLSSINLKKWEFQFAKLQEYLHENVLNVVLWSFDSLQDSTLKDIFLHIAFYMVGRKKDYALKILDGCGLHGEIGLENLTGKCLVSVGKYCDTLMMHQLIQQMGYEVVRQKPPIELGSRSRLLGPKDAYEVLRRKTGTSTVKGLHLNIVDPLDDDISPGETYAGHSPNRTRVVPFRPIKTNAFTKLSNLELLLLENVELEGGFEDFPKGIKWLLWRGCPLNEIPLDYDLDELVVLDMQKSHLIHAWNGSKYMIALKILDLSHSHHLVSTPDLFNAPMLEWISFKDCINLTEVHESTGKLENLTYLNLKECINLATLPQSIGTLKKLARFTAEGCRNLRNFPINMLGSVESLNFRGCHRLFEGSNQGESSTAVLENRSNSIIAAASNCPNKSLLVQYQVPCPATLLSSDISLPFLKKLNLSNCGISRDDVMEMISCAPSLEHLDLSHNPIRAISNVNKGSCLKLRNLNLDHCPNLQSISNIPGDCFLDIENCHSLKKITYYREKSAIKEKQRRQVEIEYGVSETVVIERTSAMNEDQASYLGFPNLNKFDYQRLYGTDFGNGIYQAGVYCVFLRGDHMAEWFPTTTTFWGGSVVRYKIPSFHPNERPIRAVNIGIVSTQYSFNYRISNASRMWEWSYAPPWPSRLQEMEEEVTLLNHWCVMEHRQIKPGDELEIRLFHRCQKLGFKIVYEDDGEGAENDEDEFHCTPGKRVDSNSSRSSQNKLMTIQTTSKEEKLQFDIQKGREERHDNNTFSSKFVSNIDFLGVGDGKHVSVAAAASASNTDFLRVEDDEEDNCDATASLESLHDGDCLNNDANDLCKVMSSSDISTSEDEEDSPTTSDVAVWYDNNFRSTDLSLYLYMKVKKLEIDEDNGCGALNAYRWHYGPQLVYFRFNLNSV